MSARRKKQRRIYDLRTLVAAGRIAAPEANAIGEAHGLGVVSRERTRLRLGRPTPRPWAVARAEEARGAR